MAIRCIVTRVYPRVMKIFWFILSHNSILRYAITREIYPQNLFKYFFSDFKLLQCCTQCVCTKLSNHRILQFITWFYGDCELRDRLPVEWLDGCHLRCIQLYAGLLEWTKWHMQQYENSLLLLTKVQLQNTVHSEEGKNISTSTILYCTLYCIALHKL